MEINFSHIRTHDGSKNSAFEELICQIAQLQKPDNGKRFVKKDGVGGDAGVEQTFTMKYAEITSTKQKDKMTHAEHHGN